MDKLLNIVKALADETRFTLVKILLQHDFCVGALAKKLNMSESAISQHLKILRNVEIVKAEKRGYYSHYYVNRDLLRKTANEIVKLSKLEKDNTEHKKTCANNHTCCQKEVKKNV